MFDVVRYLGNSLYFSYTVSIGDGDRCETSGKNIIDEII